MQTTSTMRKFPRGCSPKPSSCCAARLAHLGCPVVCVTAAGIYMANTRRTLSTPTSHIETRSSKATRGKCPECLGFLATWRLAIPYRRRQRLVRAPLGRIDTIRSRHRHRTKGATRIRRRLWLFLQAPREYVAYRGVTPTISR